jgi:hypothetical protein
MSLGWQSESALLPSKAKPIQVNNASMMGLKALMYNEEKERAQRPTAVTKRYRSTEHSLTSKNSIYDKVVNPKNTAKVFESSSNKKLERGTETDEAEEKKAAAALLAKAKLYDDISVGKVALKSSLINFNDRSRDNVSRTIGTGSGLSFPANIPPPPLPPKMPNPAKSSMHTGSNILSNSIVTSMHSSSGLADNAPLAPQWNWATSSVSADGPGATDSNTASATDDFDRDEFIANQKQELELKKEIERRIASTAVINDTASAAVPVPVHKGLKSDTNDEAFRKSGHRLNKRFQVGEEDEDEDSNEYGEQRNSVHSRQTGVSDAARVKTQWEKALQSSARSYIQEVHQETLLQRSTVGTVTVVVGGDGREGGAAETSSNSDSYSANTTAVSELSGTKRALSAKEERLELIKQRRLNSAAAAAFMQ